MDGGGHLDGAYYVSRSELLAWMNGLLGTSYRSVQECSTGVPYLRLLPSVYPNTSSIVSKGRFNAKTEYDSTSNYKLIQESFNRNSVNKVLDVEKIVKGNMHANLECLQWFKRLCDHNAVTKETLVKTGPVAVSSVASRSATSSSATASSRSPAVRSATPTMRKVLGPSSGTTGTAATGFSGRRPATATRSPGRGGDTTPNSVASGRSPHPAAPRGFLAAGSSRSQSSSAAGPLAITAQSQDEMEAVDLERRYYYDKLRDVEILVTNELRVAQMSSSQLAAEIKRLLYATYDPLQVSPPENAPAAGGNSTTE